nr:ribonuclease H-like domain-containing protein [Tanacetum cinerariifolium]
MFNALTVIDEAILQGSVEHQEIKGTRMEMQDQLSESDNEVLPSVFDGRSSDGDDNLTNDMFKKDDGYHAVPPFRTGNYMPPLPDLSFAGLNDSIYRPTANKASASISKDESSVIKTSNISIEMPKVDSVKTSEVIIEDWVSVDDDTLVDTHVDSQTTVKPSFKKIEFTKARNEYVISDKQADKPKIVTQNSKADKKDCNGNLTQKPKLGLGISKETVNTVRINGVNTAGQTSVSTIEGKKENVVKTSAAIIDESSLWHRRLGHVNFNAMNKLVKGNLVRADDAAGEEKVQEPVSEYDQALKNVLERMMNQKKEATEHSDDIRKEFQAQCNSQLLQEKVPRSSSTNSITTVSTPVYTDSASRTFIPPHDPLMPELEDTV